MIAVLTGDIVGSQKLKPNELADLGQYLKEASDLTDLSTCFEVFGGDRWQTTCHPPHSAVSLATTIRAYLLGKKGIDTRISIGIGDYKTITPEKISLSQGEAFVLSGRSLEDMPTDRRLGIELSDTIPRANIELLHASVCLLDGITVDWTLKQSQAVALSRTNLNQNELSKKFEPPISPQAFGKHLASAKWQLIKEALRSLESGLHSILIEQKSMPAKS